MVEYKVFLLNKDGRIYRVLDIAEASDEEAIARISQLDEPHGFEVWTRDRLIAKVRAEAPSDHWGAA